MADINILNEIEPSPQTAPSGRGFGGRALIVLAVIVVVIAIVGIALVRQNQGQPLSGAAPDFTVTTFDGEQFTLSEQRGKVVVLNFWASWCAPCREEAPALQRLSERYGDQVVFFGVAYAEAPEASLAFMERYGIEYANASDPRDEISKKLYRITGVPETFVIDQQGNVARFFFSAVNEPLMAAALDELLGVST
jgi:cytochrome c biogenesis protein CcmG/thiol:disulfide interchange protein DsbE